MNSCLLLEDQGVTPSLNGQSRARVVLSAVVRGTPQESSDRAMGPLSEQNVESELSYAYLHAVAAHASMSCHGANRHQDNAGIDATITAWGPFLGLPWRREVDFKIQLKSTVQVLSLVNGKLTYFLDGANQYADLTSERIATPRLLVVFCLPRTRNEWLNVDDQNLALRRCAYWVSLRGAPPSTNLSGQTVRIPPTQILNPDAMRAIAEAIARSEVPTYDPS